MLEMIDKIFHETLRRELGIESKNYLKAEIYLSESKQRAGEAHKQSEKLYTSPPHLPPKK